MTKANRKRAGRKRIAGVPRTPSGAISRSKEAQLTIRQMENAKRRDEHRADLEAATWKRRQIDPSLTVDKARGMEHGSVIANLLAKQRYTHFRQAHYDAARRFAEIHEGYMGAIDASRDRSSSDFNRTGGHDNADPFDDRTAKRHAYWEAEFKKARHEVLLSGPLGMMALETLVIENQPAYTMREDLIRALDRLIILWRVQEAA